VTAPRETRVEQQPVRRQQARVEAPLLVHGGRAPWPLPRRAAPPCDPHGRLPPPRPAASLARQSPCRCLLQASWPQLQTKCRHWQRRRAHPALRKALMEMVGRDRGRRYRGAGTLQSSHNKLPAHRCCAATGLPAAAPAESCSAPTIAASPVVPPNRLLPAAAGHRTGRKGARWVEGEMGAG
jgi:hypothetical protein